MMKRLLKFALYAFLALVGLGLILRVAGVQPAGKPSEVPVSRDPVPSVSPPEAPAAAPIQPTSKWTMSESASPMDDSRTVTLRLEATSPISGWPSKSTTPGLFVRCKERETDVYVVTELTPNVEYGAMDEATVRLRLDDGQPFSQRWSESTDKEALFVPNAIAFAKRLAKAKRLVFEFTPFNSSPQHTSFELEGLADLLPKIAQACGWSVSPAV